MKILVDTSVWSLALRKKTLTEEESDIVKELKELILDLRVIMTGPVRQELLSGISDPATYRNLRDKLKAFDNLPLKTEDYEKAAEIYNTCRKKGIQGSHIDFLICAAAINNELSIFTTDKDFEQYQRHIHIKLHTVPDKTGK
ncbi:MAG: PIN domain nuclease [Spirochaetales bacterium]|nr:MAG: PIN domain nuclease [Spirochaetales bacterium]